MASAAPDASLHAGASVQRHAPQPAPPDPEVALVSADADPDWIRESTAFQQAVAFVKTFELAIFHPWRFSAEWAEGKCQAMNPLTFFAAATAMYAAARVPLSAWAPPRPAVASAWTTEPLQSIATYAF